MSLNRLLARFDRLRRQRRLAPTSTLPILGEFAADNLIHLLQNTDSHRISWQGRGDKSYYVFTPRNEIHRWSRAINEDLFVSDPSEFKARWDRFSDSVASNVGEHSVPAELGPEIDTACYTAVMSFAANLDLFNPSRGASGTLFEMIIGPMIAALTNRTESGDIRIEVPGGYGHDTVKVDLTFHDLHGGTSLAVPTKISTRERISQAFVHARILQVASPGRYRNVLCILNENNVFYFRGTQERTVNTIFVRETLVPKTIALYQRYLASLEGLYYADPPEPYLIGAPAGLPRVAHISSLLTGDLRELLR